MSSLEMEKSVIRSATEQLSQLVMIMKPKHDENHDAAAASYMIIPLQPFISLCNSLIRVLDEIGPTMAVLRQEISKNIQRLEMGGELDPSNCSNLVEILKKEASEGNARSAASCSRAFLWLTRSLDFTAALLQKISNEPWMSVEQAVESSYDVALKPWLGWISSAAYKIALKLVPDTATFINIIMEKDQNHESFVEEMQNLISLLSVFLEESHSILRLYNLDRIKSK